MNARLWSYLRHDKKEVVGWLQRIDAEIIGSTLEFQEQQGIAGGCAEIGIHHGRTFIPLCMSLQENELALCIDLFEDQSRNLDGSGRGNFEQFQRNMDKFHVDASRVRVFKGSSEDVKPEYVLQQVGPVRYFSVDGGHWSAIVQNDLSLAEKTLAMGGVIALDDYCRAEWPDVTVGYALWQDKTESGIVPFAIGSNKLYLCHKEYAPRYRAALKTPFLERYLSKTYHAERGDMDCYRVEPIDQDEESVSGALIFAFKIFRPGLFIALKTFSSEMLAALKAKLPRVAH